MRCEKCSFENPDGLKFCGECGASLARLCTQCGFANPAGFKFCGECGTSLTAAGQRRETSVMPRNLAPAESPPVEVDSAERRQLTVMFCDLANSATFSDTLDPEELRNLIVRYQSACAESVARFGGHVAQYLGDGILVYFGFPKAHEDDARRAVYSALGCIEAVRQLNHELHLDAEKQLIVRVGIHTGLVVTGEIGAPERREHLALGRTPNVAARLQSIAAPNSVVISGDTYRLVEGFFETEFLGEQLLKGIHAPVRCYTVTRDTDAKDRFDIALRCGGLTPLVGRQFEIDQLAKLWDKATLGQGQVVMIKGEAGVGKSRLMHAFYDYVKDQRHSYLVAHGVAYGGGSSLRPVIEMLESVFGFESQDLPAARLHKMTLALKKQGMQVAQVLPLFAALLGLPAPDGYEDVALSPERKKKRTLEAVFELITNLSQEQPLLFVVEDLHWLDPSTLELLDLLVKQGPTQRIFVFFSCRPTFTSPWFSRSNMTEFNLSQLSETETRAMVKRLTQNRGLPDEIVREIIAKTDGVPLFVEELTKMVIESGMVKEQGERYVINAGYSSLKIPSTLQDSLTARLDGLGNAKEVAQLAAIIGREFGFDLLRAAGDYDKADLERRLQILLDAELCFQRNAGFDKSYVFKHALIQEAAAHSMLKSRRQQFHEKIANIVERDYPEIARTRPEYLAEHYSQAGKFDAAVDWWLRAGQRALAMSANLEAIGHLENGLRLLAGLPNTELNRQRELQLQTTLGPAYSATSGYAAPQVEKAYGRARELCRQIGETPELFSTLWGSWAYYVVKGDLGVALENATEMLRLAQARRNSALLLEANMALGLAHYFLGKPQEAIVFMERAAALDNEEHDRAFTYVSGQDAGVCNLVFMGLTLWQLGKPKEALQRSREAVALARRLKHPFSLAYALNFSAWLRFMMRKPESAASLAEEEIALSEQQGFFWNTLGSVIVGWSEAQRGNVSDGLAKIRDGLAAYRQPGAHLSETLQLAIEAEVLMQSGDLDEATARIQEALDAAELTKERFWLAELHRLLGDIQWKRGDHGAEEHYRQALQIADEQGAEGLKLRAATRLAKLLHVQRRAGEANDTLLPHYEAQRLNIDLADVQEAESLLHLFQGRAGAAGVSESH